MTKAETWTFTDYAPLVFKRFRAMCGVDESEYLLALGTQTNLRCWPPLSVEVFFFFELTTAGSACLELLHIIFFRSRAGVGQSAPRRSVHSLGPAVGRQVGQLLLLQVPYSYHHVCGAVCAVCCADDLRETTQS